jgi:hypothetical protein
MNQKRADRIETITQKFIGMLMWKTRAENLMLLGIQDKADEALCQIVQVVHQLKEINQEEVK